MVSGLFQHPSQAWHSHEFKVAGAVCSMIFQVRQVPWTILLYAMQKRLSCIKKPLAVLDLDAPVVVCIKWRSFKFNLLIPNGWETWFDAFRSVAMLSTGPPWFLLGIQAYRWGIHVSFGYPSTKAKSMKTGMNRSTLAHADVIHVMSGGESGAIHRRLDEVESLFGSNYLRLLTGPGFSDLLMLQSVHPAGYLQPTSKEDFLYKCSIWYPSNWSCQRGLYNIPVKRFLVSAWSTDRKTAASRDDLLT
jgi:hypothetical protein